MSYEHLKAALRIRCTDNTDPMDNVKHYPDKAERLLIALAMRASAGKPLRNGKIIPFGECQVSDKTLMPEVGTNRAKTMTQCRKDLEAMDVLTYERRKNSFKRKSTFPVNHYKLNLARMNELAGLHATQSAQEDQGHKVPEENGHKVTKNRQENGHKVLHKEGSFPSDVLDVREAEEPRWVEEELGVGGQEKQQPIDGLSNDNNRVVVVVPSVDQVVAAIPNPSGKETKTGLVAGYTQEQIAAQAEACKLNPWVHANDSPKARLREGYVRHLMDLEPPKRALKMVDGKPLPEYRQQSGQRKILEADCLGCGNRQSKCSCPKPVAQGFDIEEA